MRHLRTDVVEPVRTLLVGGEHPLVLNRVPISSIVINTDHSHAGPDMIGLWGGVPVSYMQLVRDQTVKALDDTFRNRVRYLIAPASEYPWITYSNLGNDNSFFNVSVNYGDHDYCTQTSAAAAIGFTKASGNPSPYGAGAIQPRCPILTASDVVPKGPTPQLPWPFGDGISAPPLPVSP